MFSVRFGKFFYDLGSFLYHFAVSFLKFILPLKQHMCNLQLQEKMDNKETNRTKEECYTLPDFEVFEIQFEQNILGGSTEDFAYEDDF